MLGIQRSEFKFYTLRNLHNAFKGYAEAREADRRNRLIASRLEATLVMSSLSGKKTKPTDVIVFEWEKQEAWYKEKYKPYTDEEKKSIVEYYEQRKTPG